MAIFAACCMCTMLLAATSQFGPASGDTSDVFLPSIQFALIMTSLGVVFSLFRVGEPKSLSVVLTRTAIVLAVGFPVSYAMFGYVTGGAAAREVLASASLYALAGVVLIRAAVSTALGAGVGLQRVLIVGTGAEALAVEKVISHMGPRRAVVVGFYPAGSDETAIEADSAGTAPRFPSSIDLSAIVERFKVDEVIIAVREQRGGVLPIRDLLECRIGGVPVRDLSAFYERVRGEVPIESLKASWLIYGDGFAQDATRTIVKRVFDLALAGALLLLALPVMLLTVIAIFVESGAPVFLFQERVGRGGRPFLCVKFRSMRTDAERDGVPRWATVNDVRVTRVGRLIRKLRIDELPQLFNVLSGEMSLVGPRPERPQFVSGLKEQIRFYDVRHSIKPGITGWAQIRYTYGSSVEDSK
ncbi:MAG: TIGR03013 family PEP-CTERM/XrtA system glycosyltransferase, partial [Burkholderiaceae bacterium]|nr:TIGR03013 family PEP-CTERM/XrtA system glycosyltransferase [Burkholderiaceae bacterium]